MNSIKLFAVLILISLISAANATSDAGFEPKKIAQCGSYSLLQYKYVTFFGGGIVHSENRYELAEQDPKDTINVEFKSHSEGADLEATQVYEYNPRTGAAIQYRKLSIHSWGKLFYMDIAESNGGKSKINCVSIP